VSIVCVYASVCVCMPVCVYMCVNPISCVDNTQEVFVSRLAEYLGVRCPRMRVVEYVNAEWTAMKQALFSLAGSLPNGTTEQMKVRKEMDRAFVIVMELAEGRPLCALGPHLGSLLCVHTHTGRERLRAIGRVCALDVLCNNWDRLPLIWSNDGNLDNIFVGRCCGAAGATGVTALDNGWMVLCVASMCVCVCVYVCECGWVGGCFFGFV
jgi:Actin-fragmin kinase, catalytic